MGQAAIGCLKRVGRYEKYDYEIDGGGGGAGDSRHYPRHPWPRTCGAGCDAA